MREHMRIQQKSEVIRIVVVAVLLACFVAVVVAFPFPGSEITVDDILVTDCSRGGGDSRSYVSFSLEQLVALSDAVIRGTIESCEDYGHWILNEVRVLETLKGVNHTGTTIQVANDPFCCFGEGLEHYMFLRETDRFTYSTGPILVFVVAGRAVVFNDYKPNPYDSDTEDGGGSVPLSIFRKDLKRALAASETK